MGQTTITDHWGDPWSVFSARDTIHGWMLYMGRPTCGVPMNRCGGNRAIPTTPLVDYVTRTPLCEVQLPLGRTTIKRLRKLLGLDARLEARQWWEDHADELASMTEAAFAAKYGYSPARVSQVNKVLFGKRLREPGWWREEPARSLLSSDASRLMIAEALGISIGTVGRLRWVLRGG